MRVVQTQLLNYLINLRYMKRKNNGREQFMKVLITLKTSPQDSTQKKEFSFHRDLSEKEITI